METKQIIKWYDLDQENNVIILFADKLYKDRKAHFAELFKCFFSKPKINHPFQKYTSSQQLRFFETKPLYFEVRAEYVYLQGGFLKPTGNIYPKISGAVNFLLRCFDTLHYLDIKKVIMFLFDDIARYIYQVSFENERALIQTIPNIIFDESGEMKLATPCEMRTKHITLDDKMLLAMVCYLVLYGKTFREYLLKKIKGIAPMEFELLFKGSTAKQWNFLEKHIDCFRISGNEVVQLYEYYASFSYDYQRSASEGPPFSRGRTNAGRHSCFSKKMRTKLPNTVTRKDNLDASRKESLKGDALLGLNKKFCTAVQFLLNCFDLLHYLELTESICFVLKDVGTYLLGMSSSSRKQVFSKIPSTTMDELGFLQLSHSMLETSTKKESIRLDLNLVSKDDLLLLFIVYFLSLQGRTHFEVVIKEVRNRTPQVISMILTCASTPGQLAYLKKHQEYFRTDSDFYLELPSTFVLPIGSSSSGDSSDDARSSSEVDCPASKDYYSFKNGINEMSVGFKDDISCSFSTRVEAEEFSLSRENGASCYYVNRDDGNTSEPDELKVKVSYSFVNGVDTRLDELSWSKDYASPCSLVNGDDVRSSRTGKPKGEISSNFANEVDARSLSRDNSISCDSMNSFAMSRDFHDVSAEPNYSGGLLKSDDFSVSEKYWNWKDENLVSNKSNYSPNKTLERDTQFHSKNSTTSSNIDESGWTFVKSKSLVQTNTNHSTKRKDQSPPAISPVKNKSDFISDRLLFATLYLLKFFKRPDRRLFLQVILHVLHDVLDYFLSLSYEDKLNLIRCSFAAGITRGRFVSIPAGNDSTLSQQEKQLLYFCCSTYFYGKSYFDKLYNEFFKMNKCTPPLGTYSDKLMYFKNLKDFFVVDKDGYVKSCPLRDSKIDRDFLARVFELYNSATSRVKVSTLDKKSSHSTAAKDNKIAANSSRSRVFDANANVKLAKCKTPENDTSYALLDTDDIQYCLKKTTCVKLKENKYALLKTDETLNRDIEIENKDLKAQVLWCKNNVAYKKLCESMLFLLTCFGQLHYTHLMKCIMHVLDDVDLWLKSLSYEKQQEVFSSISSTALTTDNCVPLTTPYKYDVKYVSKKKLRLLYIVSYLVVHGKTHVSVLLEELYRSVPELTISNLTGPEDRNWHELLKQLKYFELNSLQILSLSSFFSDGVHSVSESTSLLCEDKILPIKCDTVEKETETEQEVLDCSNQVENSIETKCYHPNKETFDRNPSKELMECSNLSEGEILDGMPSKTNVLSFPSKEVIDRRQKLSSSLPSLPSIVEENISKQSEGEDMVNNKFEHKAPQNKGSLDLVSIASGESVTNTLLNEDDKTKTSKPMKNKKIKAASFSKEVKNSAQKEAECSTPKKEVSDLKSSISSTMLTLLNAEEDDIEVDKSAEVKNIPVSDSTVCSFSNSTKNHKEKSDNPFAYNTEETKRKLRRKLKSKKNVAVSCKALHTTGSESNFDTEALNFKSIENKTILAADSTASHGPIFLQKEITNLKPLQSRFNFNMRSKPLIDAASILHSFLNSKETGSSNSVSTDLNGLQSNSTLPNYFWLMETLPDHIKKMTTVEADPSESQVNRTLNAIQCNNDSSDKFCKKQACNLDQGIDQIAKKYVNETAKGTSDTLINVCENSLVSRHSRSSPTSLLKKFMSLKSQKSPQKLAEKSSAIVERTFTGEVVTDIMFSSGTTNVVNIPSDFDKGVIIKTEVGPDAVSTSDVKIAVEKSACVEKAATTKTNSNGTCNSIFTSVAKNTFSSIISKIEENINELCNSNVTIVAENTSGLDKDMTTDETEVNADATCSFAITNKSEKPFDVNIVTEKVETNNVAKCNSDAVNEFEKLSVFDSFIKKSYMNAGLICNFAVTNVAKKSDALCKAATTEKIKEITGNLSNFDVANEASETSAFIESKYACKAKESVATTCKSDFIKEDEMLSGLDKCPISLKTNVVTDTVCNSVITSVPEMLSNFNKDTLTYKSKENTFSKSAVTEKLSSVYKCNVTEKAKVNMVTFNSEIKNVAETSFALEKHIAKKIQTNTFVTSDPDISYIIEKTSVITKGVITDKANANSVAISNCSSYVTEKPLASDVAAITEESKAATTCKSDIPNAQNLVPKKVDIPGKIHIRMKKGVEFLSNHFKCIPDLNLVSVVLHALYEAKYAFLLLSDSEQINLVKKVLVSNTGSSSLNTASHPSCTFELSEEQKSLLLYSYILSQSPKIHYREIPLKFKKKELVTPVDHLDTYVYITDRSSFFVIDDFGCVKLKGFPPVQWKTDFLFSDLCINFKEKGNVIAENLTIDEEKPFLKEATVKDNKKIEVSKIEKIADKNKFINVEGISRRQSTMNAIAKFTEVVGTKTENVAHKSICIDQKGSREEFIVTEDIRPTEVKETLAENIAEKNLSQNKQESTSKEKCTVQRVTDPACIKETKIANKNVAIDENRTPKEKITMKRILVPAKNELEKLAISKDVDGKSSIETSIVKGVEDNKEIKSKKMEQITNQAQTLLQDLSESLHDSIVYLMQYFDLKANTWFLEIALHVVEGCAPFFELSHLQQQEVIKISLRRFYINKQQIISYPYVKGQKIFKLKWGEKELLCLSYILRQRGMMHYREVFKKYEELIGQRVLLSDSDQIWFFKGRKDLFFVTISGHVNLVNVPVIKLDFKSVLGSDEPCASNTSNILVQRNTLNSSSVDEDLNSTKERPLIAKSNWTKQTQNASMSQISTEKRPQTENADLPSNSSSAAKSQISTKKKNPIEGQIFAEKVPPVTKADLPTHVQNSSSAKPHNSSKIPLSTEKIPPITRLDLPHEISASSNGAKNKLSLNSSTNYSKPEIKPSNCAKNQCCSTDIGSGVALLFFKRIKESIIFLSRSFEVVSSQQIIRTILLVLHNVRGCFFDETDFYSSTLIEINSFIKSERRMLNQPEEKHAEKVASISEQEKDLLVLVCILIVCGPMCHEELFKRFETHGRNVEQATSGNRYLYLEKQRRYFAINDRGDVILSKNQTLKALDDFIEYLELKMSFQSAILEGGGSETLAKEETSNGRYKYTGWIGYDVMHGIHEFCNDVIASFRNWRSHNEFLQNKVESRNLRDVFSVGANPLENLQNRNVAPLRELKPDSKPNKINSYLVLKKADHFPLRHDKHPKGHSDNTLPCIDKSPKILATSEMIRSDVQLFKDVAKNSSTCNKDLTSSLGQIEPVLPIGMCYQSDVSSLTSSNQCKSSDMKMSCVTIKHNKNETLPESKACDKSSNISATSVLNVSEASKDKSIHDKKVPLSLDSSNHVCSASTCNNCSTGTTNILQDISVTSLHLVTKAEKLFALDTASSRKPYSNHSRTTNDSSLSMSHIPNERKSSQACDNSPTTANSQKMTMLEQKDKMNSTATVDHLKVGSDCCCTKDANKELRTLNFFVSVLSRSRGGLTILNLAGKLRSAPIDVQHYIACAYKNNVRNFLLTHVTFYISPTSNVVYWRR